jgi:serine/threonine protein kinase
MSNSFCGTPEYVSPEMLDGTGHDKTLDWWAVGILIYEMLAGIPPFYSKDQDRMFHKIQHAQIPWPNKEKNGFGFSSTAIDIITKLLTKDKSKRFGAKNDVDEILSHKFFKGINIKHILEKKVKAPFVPKNKEFD